MQLEFSRAVRLTFTVVRTTKRPALQRTNYLILSWHLDQGLSARRVNFGAAHQTAGSSIRQLYQKMVDAKVNKYGAASSRTEKIQF